MYKKILVPLDGSQLSEGILPYARLFAGKLKIPVELWHVIDPETLMPKTVERDRYDEMLAAERQKNNDYLKKIAASFSDVSLVDCAIEVGNPAEVIVDRAAANKETLIAIATHGRSGVGRWLLGSVADKVLHAASNHLLLVRPNGVKSTEPVSLKSILVPLDGSALAETVLPHVVQLSKKMALEVLLLRVCNLPATYAPNGYSIDGKILELIEDEAQNYLDEKVKQLKGEGLSEVRSSSVIGFPAEEIIERARKTPQTLVSMCTHGRTGVGRWVLGSVTERVVRHSGDPVLVIRAPIERKKG